MPTGDVDADFPSKASSNGCWNHARRGERFQNIILDGSIEVPRDLFHVVWKASIVSDSIRSTIATNIRRQLIATALRHVRVNTDPNLAKGLLPKLL